MSSATCVSGVSGCLWSPCRPRPRAPQGRLDPSMSPASQAVPLRPVYKSVYRTGSGLRIPGVPAFGETALGSARTPPPNPTAAEPNGGRILSGVGVADHEVTPKAPWTGSGWRGHSYGGFGGGHSPRPAVGRRHSNLPNLGLSAWESVQSGPSIWADLRNGLSVSDRESTRFTPVNGPLMARRPDHAGPPFRVIARTVEGMAPYPGQASCLALNCWPECFRRLTVNGGRRPFPKETRSAVDGEGKYATIQGPSLAASPATQPLDP